MKHIRVNNAATGCTIRMADREDRVPEGREKAELSFSLLNIVLASVQVKDVSKCTYCSILQNGLFLHDYLPGVQFLNSWLTRISRVLAIT